MATTRTASTSRRAALTPRSPAVVVAALGLVLLGLAAWVGGADRRAALAALDTLESDVLAQLDSDPAGPVEERLTMVLDARPPDPDQVLLALVEETPVLRSQTTATPRIDLDGVARFLGAPTGVTQQAEADGMPYAWRAVEVTDASGTTGTLVLAAFPDLVPATAPGATAALLLGGLLLLGVGGLLHAGTTRVAPGRD